MGKKDVRSLFNFLLNTRDATNLVFVLLFDKDIVLESLGQKKDSKYLERFFADTIDLEIYWKYQVRQLINKKLHHDCAEISYYLSRYITNLRELKAIINKILESDYWNACHLDRNSIIILECLRYINSDIYRIIKDNSEPTFEEKKLPDALSKLDETNPVKQYLRDTNIIDTASERNQPIELELNHWCLNPSLKYYFKDHEEDTMVTRKDLGLLIDKENNIVEFQKGFNALIEKGKDKDGQSKRLNNLIMGKQLLLANELKSSSTEPFPFVGNLPEIWLLAIANLDESHDNIFGVFLYDTRIVSKQGCSISPFSLIWLSPLLKDFDNKLSLKVLYEIYSVAQEKHDDEVLKKINAYVENKENQDYLCEASCNIDLTYAIQFVWAD